MSLRNSFIFKTFCSILLIAGLGACGFQPVHGNRQTAQNMAMKQELTKVWVHEIKDREGQLLHNELLTLFNPKGRPRAPLYELEVSYSESQQGLGIGKDEFATRANLRVNASFNLTGSKPFKGKSRSVVSFNILKSPTGTEFAKRDARKRAIQSIARDIHRRIAVHLLNATPVEKEKPVRILK